jgi:hypothetical protein
MNTILESAAKYWIVISWQEKCKTIGITRKKIEIILILTAFLGKLVFFCRKNIIVLI